MKFNRPCQAPAGLYTELTYVRVLQRGMLMAGLRRYRTHSLPDMAKHAVTALIVERHQELNPRNNAGTEWRSSAPGER